MSWGSRFGGWAPSRWSPFTSRGDPSSNTVTDSDYSYITSDDLADHGYAHHSSRHDPRDRQQHSHHRTSSLQTSRTARDSDILTLRHQRISYPIHFPAYSIDDGELTIGAVRDAAARKLDVADARRIRMFYKGRNLKDDRRLCLDEGFHSDTPSDILCVVGDRLKERDDRSASGSDDNDEDDDGDDDEDSPAAAAAAGVPKKKKRRNRKKKSKKSSGTSTPASMPNVEHLPVPTGAHPAHRTASPATPIATSRPQTPQTPQQKLESIAATFHESLMPQCQSFIEAPPEETAKREFEHKKLTETILAQVLLKLDAVETEGDEVARARRKGLVKEVQGYLNQLDGVLKG